MKKFCIIIFILLCPVCLYPDIFFLDGKSVFINAKANLTYTIPIKDSVDNLNIIIYKFKNFTNGVNKQIISTYNPTVYPKPTFIKHFEDNLGNQGVQIYFKNISTDIKIMSNFIIDNEVELSPIINFYDYPLNKSAVHHLSQYLKGTSLCSISQLKIPKLIVRKIIRASKYEYQVVLRILSWIQNNIQFSPNIHYNDAKTTFLKRKGNRNGILNLTLSMLRMAQIPSRFVHGFSIKKNYIFKSKNNDINLKNLNPEIINDNSFLFEGKADRQVEIKYPKSVFNWIEIYFPNRDWVSFDPLGYYFFLPVNIIKRNVSLDSSDYLNRAIAHKRNYEMRSQLFIELSKELDNITVEDHFQETANYLLFPTFPFEEGQFVKSLFQLKKRGGQKGYQVIKDELVTIVFNPISLELIDDKEQIELKVTPEFHYSQRVYVENNFYLKEIRLPLFRFNNSPSGKIWIEVYESDQQGFPSNKLILKSGLLDVSGLDNAGKYS
ncbi:MAG: transglutaminase family protein, partial [Spirochaetota bacterium]|nr:transglutaminase family protein [Spirochaetota bacterium]